MFFVKLVRMGPLPGDHRPDVLGVKARAEGGCPEPGCKVV